MQWIIEEQIMQRCFDLARRGMGQASPNPLVGAVLVHDGRIIGEGYHEKFGGPHAEVNALASVAVNDRPLIRQGTLYVSLEPCCIYGKTPPCTNLILEHGIRRVVVSCLDPSPEVNGRGIAALRKAGIDVKTGVLEALGKLLISPRRTFTCEKRPHIILKWAETSNGFMAPLKNTPFWISNVYSRRIVHRWRMEADAILVGAGTAISDNPELNNRYYYGKSPLRIVIDPTCTLPPHLHLFDGSAPTLLVHKKGLERQALQKPSVSPITADTLAEMLEALHKRSVGILLVEGGPATLGHFIREGFWDEARVITSAVQVLPEGRRPPSLPVRHAQEFYLGSDRIRYYYPLPPR
jgi:diaminohydroxyphosphoribosylaminopyrimidine deaminase/5-amino-6-(5-phosphoribosylamino)uracil reductase